MNSIEPELETNPLVSIVLPVHNEARWLVGCIDSLLAQTHKSIEIIIINDGSTDASEEVIKQLKKRNPEIISSISFTTMRGEGAARTEGLIHTHGAYIIETDADTLFPENFIERGLQYITEDKSDAISLGRLKVHPEKHGILANYWRAKRDASHSLRLQQKKEDVIGIIMFSRQVKDRLDHYDATVPSGTDFDFAMRAKTYGFHATWAEDIFFYHADVTNWWQFFKRLFNASRYNAPVLKRWRRWLSKKQQLGTVIMNIFSTALLLFGFLGVVKPLFFLLWIAAFLIEGFVPILIHNETRLIAQICVQKKWFKTLLFLPVITFIRVRASGWGKTYAILFPKKIERAVSFDV